MPNPLEDILKDCEAISLCKFSQFKVVRDVLEKVVKSQSPFDMSVLSTEGAYFNDHGYDHLERIEKNFFDLVSTARIKLTCCETYLALLSIWFHDIGLFLGRRKGETAEDARKYHHERVKDVIKGLVDANLIPAMSTAEEVTLTSICEGHSRKVDLNTIPVSVPLKGETVRPRLLSALLRISDALDIDNRRAPEAIFELFEDFIQTESLKHWKKHQHISGIKFNKIHAAIEIYVNFDESLENFVEQYLLVNWVKEEIKSELDTVREIFDQNSIPFHNVYLVDHGTGQIIITDPGPSQGSCKITLEEDKISSDVLAKLSDLIKSHNGETRVSLEILLSKGGNVAILLPEKYSINYTEELFNEIKKICKPILMDIKRDAKSKREIIK